MQITETLKMMGVEFEPLTLDYIREADDEADWFRRACAQYAKKQDRLRGKEETRTYQDRKPYFDMRRKQGKS